jgi:putative ABC transport system permease protein
MFDKDNWQEIFAAIKKTSPYFPNSFSVFWGIFMLVIMLGSGAGLSNGITQGFEGTAINSFFVWTQNFKAYKGRETARTF